MLVAEILTSYSLLTRKDTYLNPDFRKNIFNGTKSIVICRCSEFLIFIVRPEISELTKEIFLASEKTCFYNFCTHEVSISIRNQCQSKFS